MYFCVLEKTLPLPQPAGTISSWPASPPPRPSTHVGDTAQTRPANPGCRRNLSRTPTSQTAGTAETTSSLVPVACMQRDPPRGTRSPRSHARSCVERAGSHCSRRYILCLRILRCHHFQCLLPTFRRPNEKHDRKDDVLHDVGLARAALAKEQQVVDTPLLGRQALLLPVSTHHSRRKNTNAQQLQEATLRVGCYLFIYLFMLNSPLPHRTPCPAHLQSEA